MSPDLHDFSKIMSSFAMTQTGLLQSSGGYYQGPLMCRGHAPVIVHIPTLSLLTVGLCINLHFCSPGLKPNGAGKDRGEENIPLLFSLAGD